MIDSSPSEDALLGGAGETVLRAGLSMPPGGWFWGDGLRSPSRPSLLGQPLRVKLGPLDRRGQGLGAHLLARLFLCAQAVLILLRVLRV